MTKDKELENLFATAIQEFNDNDHFTADLSSKHGEEEMVFARVRRSAPPYLQVKGLAPGGPVSPRR